MENVGVDVLVFFGVTASTFAAAGLFFWLRKDD